MTAKGQIPVQLPQPAPCWGHLQVTPTLLRRTKVKTAACAAKDVSASRLVQGFPSSQCGLKDYLTQDARVQI